ncbi:MAG: hypothetical protein J6B55_08080 [Clostridia bacterium]|nr:hypothetical protein [Clostridia bacterium]
MKRLLTILAVMALLLTSCVSTRPLDRDKLPAKDDGTGLPVVDNRPADIGNDQIEIPILSDQYSAWANWTDDERVTQGIVNPDTVSHTYPRKHLPLYRIDSTGELEKFIEDYGDVFSMNYKYDENEGFAVATSHCDTAFFEDKYLLVAYVEAPSGSFRYGARNITIDDGALTLEIEQTNDPEAHTDDMSGWLVTAEVIRADVTTNCTSYDAVFAGIKGREDEPYVPQIIMSEPPTLAVITPDGSIKASMGTSSWFYPVGDGTSGANMYDSNHPTSKQFIDVMPRLSNDKYYDVTGGVYAKLAFDFQRVPEISIKRWKCDGENVFSEPEQVQVFDDICFHINQDGEFIYEVTAVWDTSIDGYGGNVTYVFSIGPSK